MFKKVIKNTNWNLVLIALLPLAFYFAVKLSVAHLHHSICIFKFFTGHECLGCGITRAFNALFQFKFFEAYSYNPRIVIVAPLLFFVWVQTMYSEIKRARYHETSDVV